jgi:hypothetical protein
LSLLGGNIIRQQQGHPDRETNKAHQDCEDRGCNQLLWFAKIAAPHEALNVADNLEKATQIRFKKICVFRDEIDDRDTVHFQLPSDLCMEQKDVVG